MTRLAWPLPVRQPRSQQAGDQLCQIASLRRRHPPPQPRHQCRRPVPRNRFRNRRDHHWAARHQRSVTSCRAAPPRTVPTAAACGPRPAAEHDSALFHKPNPGRLPHAAASAAGRPQAKRSPTLAGARTTGSDRIAAQTARVAVLYKRASRLFTDLAQARGEGRLLRLMTTLERTRLLIIDDWGPEPLNAEQRRDLLEIVDDRYDRGALLITSQVPVNRWHEVIGDPTLADAILDRIVHRAHRIDLKGPSLRRRLVASESSAA